MLRFVPDGWFEGLLRPFFMADPVPGLYLEDSAPDWRFAAFFVLMGLGFVLRRRAVPLTPAQGVTALGTVVLLYLWTFVSGNGRYFAWALLLIGPLLVMAVMRLPVSRSVRWTLLLSLLAVQGVAINFSRSPNHWALVRMTEEPLPLGQSPLRERPAVFVTVSNLTYSILVPQFHPESRWANIAGQYNILPGTLEWGRLQALLASPLPKYLVTPVRPEDHDVSGQPFGVPLHVLQSVLARYSLALVQGGCTTLWSKLSGPGRIEALEQARQRGFWICALQDRVPDGTPSQPVAVAISSANIEALDEVERRCPRFFRPGAGQPSLVEGAYLRHYAWSDVRLWVHPEGVVLFQYYRAMNPTVLGRVGDVRAGRFSLNCDKLPGRYVPFWERD